MRQVIRILMISMLRQVSGFGPGLLKPKKNLKRLHVSLLLSIIKTLNIFTMLVRRIMMRQWDAEMNTLELDMIQFMW